MSYGPQWTQVASDDWYVPHQGPRCPCGLYPLGDDCPYCSVASSRKSLAPVISASDDARLEAARERAKAISSAQVEAFRAGVIPEKSDKKPTRKRRNKLEMAAARAAEQTRDEQVKAAVTPAWLAERDADLDDFIQRISDQ